jgi:hypothetical protein
LDSRRFEAVDEHLDLRTGGSFSYNLYAIADDGGWDLLRAEVVEIEPPSAAARLVKVHPNPFNPETTISFSVTVPQVVRIDIHDAAGRRVTTLANRRYPAGDFDVRWDGRDATGRGVASGIYFVRFAAGKTTESKKLVLLK